MAELTTESVLDALRLVVSPELKKDIVALNLVHDVAIRNSEVWMTLRVPSGPPEQGEQLEEVVRDALKEIGARDVHLRVEAPASGGPPGGASRSGIPGVKRVVAVGSGKGGVGKTTVSVNLAIALVEQGHAVGLMDADVYGPNVPLMMNVQEMPRVLPGNWIEPLRGYGVRFISMGLINPGDKPVIWRGPMLHSAVQQFLRQVQWGELDYLLVDLPPGTGDVALSLSQNVPIAGAVVVTTPSDVSLQDARKALNMFRQFNIDILGIVENMSYFVCPHCANEVDVFSRGGGRRTAEGYGVPFLGALPLDPAVRQGGDTGRPVTLEGPSSERARPFYALAERLVEELQSHAAPDPSDILHVRA
jgi:ATP-binding protein involved in chromosome partitioning